MNREMWKKHKGTVEAVYLELQGKEALLKSWEEKEVEDPEYVSGLREKVRRLKVRYFMMDPVVER